MILIPLEPSPQPPHLTVPPRSGHGLCHSRLLGSQRRRRLQFSLECLVLAALKEHPGDSDEMITLVLTGFLGDACDELVVNQTIQGARSLPPARAP